MIAGSVCSGIGAAEMAWGRLGFDFEFVSEIETFPREVLKHRFGAGSDNGPKLFGDFTEIQETDIDRPINILVGGTPCQAFSIAGKRLGLADPRGNLALEYVALARRLRPDWGVWENVPGVLSSDGGRDFGTFLAMLAGHADGRYLEPRGGRWGNFGIVEPARPGGYGCAWRVLDAQHVRVESHPYAVPQRRRRVFVVGYLGDWRRAAAVLFEPEGLQGHPAPCRESGEGTAVDVAPSLVSSGRGVERAGETRGQDPVVAEPLTTRPYADNNGRESGLIARAPLVDEISHTLNAGSMGRQDWETESFVAFSSKDHGAPLFVSHTLRAEGFDASEDGTGRGTPIVPVAFSSKDHGADATEGVSPTLRAMGHDGSHANGGGQVAVAFTTEQTPKASLESAFTLTTTSPTGGGHPQAVAFAQNQRDELRTMDVAGALAAEPGAKQQTYLAEQWAVRRLTPTECSRLQGFPDDHARIPWRGKPAEQCPDGPQYKGYGNSMAVNVMSWIGQRIKMVDQINE